jgi:RNA polymerase sigma factor (TIGR02999 family)
MSEVTHILSAIEAGDPHAAEQLLPLVYDELRKLAARKLAQEKPGQTLEATALVHEAYLRLVDVDKAQHWNSRGHFFAAAAEAMRQILVQNARRRSRVKHGGGRTRIDVDDLEIAAPERSEDLLALDEALTQLAAADPQAAELVKLRYFAGCTIPQAAEVLGVSPERPTFSGPTPAPGFSRSCRAKGPRPRPRLWTNPRNRKISLRDLPRKSTLQVRDGR